MNRPRKVFGRVHFTARSEDGPQKEFIVELTKQGLHLRQKRHRRGFKLSLTQLVDVVKQQLLLPL
jgi:hypothetical protein